MHFFIYLKERYIRQISPTQFYCISHQIKLGIRFEEATLEKMVRLDKTMFILLTDNLTIPKYNHTTIEPNASVGSKLN